MNVKRRLHNLECRPARLPKTNPAMDRAIQKRLALPLPEHATAAERAECLRLLVEAQARTRINRDDTGGLDAVRAFAIGLHRHYGTDPFWGE